MVEFLKPMVSPEGSNHRRNQDIFIFPILFTIWSCHQAMIGIPLQILGFLDTFTLAHSLH